MSHKTLRYSVYGYPCQKKIGIIGILLSNSYSAICVQWKSRSYEVMAPHGRDVRIRPLSSTSRSAKEAATD